MWCIFGVYIVTIFDLWPHLKIRNEKMKLKENTVEKIEMFAKTNPKRGKIKRFNPI